MDNYLPCLADQVGETCGVWVRVQVCVLGARHVAAGGGGQLPAVPGGPGGGGVRGVGKGAWCVLAAGRCAPLFIFPWPITFPPPQERLAFACSAVVGELWPSLIEKAYAKVRGGAGLRRVQGAGQHGVPPGSHPVGPIHDQGPDAARAPGGPHSQAADNPPIC